MLICISKDLGILVRITKAHEVLVLSTKTMQVLVCIKPMAIDNQKRCLSFARAFVDRREERIQISSQHMLHAFDAVLSHVHIRVLNGLVLEICLLKPWAFTRMLLRVPVVGRVARPLVRAQFAKGIRHEIMN